ncbi:MAG: hypothetical protein LBQ94_09665 [Treponema sp.]|jgi:hypothetical protein|nr:hypothetical protein [Treponema sp.]
MLSREDFVFTVGYDGPVAVVDKQAKRKYGKLSTRELAGKGLFRAAYSSAVYSGNQDDVKFVAEAFWGLSAADSSGTDLSKTDLAGLDRLFGVFVVDAKRALYI